MPPPATFISHGCALARRVKTAAVALVQPSSSRTTVIATTASNCIFYDFTWVFYSRSPPTAWPGHATAAEETVLAATPTVFICGIPIVESSVTTFSCSCILDNSAWVLDSGCSTAAWARDLASSEEPVLRSPPTILFRRVESSTFQSLRRPEPKVFPIVFCSSF